MGLPKQRRSKAQGELEAAVCKTRNFGNEVTIVAFLAIPVNLTPRCTMMPQAGIAVDAVVIGVMAEDPECTSDSRAVPVAHHESDRQPGSNPARTTFWGAITRTRMRLRASFNARSTAARLFGAKRSA